MEIIYCSDDIFSSDCECIVNPTNSMGIMGGGLARAFALKYPATCLAYNEATLEFREKNGEELKLMPPMLYAKSEWNNDKHLMMFATKIHWKFDSRLGYIRGGMPTAIALLNAHKIDSVSFPALGCGLGGLKTEDVFPIMEKNFKNFLGSKVRIHSL